MGPVLAKDNKKDSFTSNQPNPNKSGRLGRFLTYSSFVAICTAFQLFNPASEGIFNYYNAKAATRVDGMPRFVEPQKEQQDTIKGVTPTKLVSLKSICSLAVSDAIKIARQSIQNDIRNELGLAPNDEQEAITKIVHFEIHDDSPSVGFISKEKEQIVNLLTSALTNINQNQKPLNSEIIYLGCTGGFWDTNQYLQHFTDALAERLTFHLEQNGWMGVCVPLFRPYRSSVDGRLKEISLPIQRYLNTVTSRYTFGLAIGSTEAAATEGYKTATTFKVEIPDALAGIDSFLKQRVSDQILRATSAYTRQVNRSLDGPELNQLLAFILTDSAPPYGVWFSTSVTPKGNDEDSMVRARNASFIGQRELERYIKYFLEPVQAYLTSVGVQSKILTEDRDGGTYVSLAFSQPPEERLRLLQAAP
ncbi:MAG: hypothetical protein M1530_04200 [Candidatus Marsarchaeota archaeon]|nr:hypothetical protein [Candidatus Marsarchaeota archaeon]